MGLMDPNTTCELNSYQDFFTHDSLTDRGTTRTQIRFHTGSDSLHDPLHSASGLWVIQEDLDPNNIWVFHHKYKYQSYFSEAYLTKGAG